jgi:methylmalonyl-CoA/ethylmalonyl-CoA epimerase
LGAPEIGAEEILMLTACIFAEGTLRFHHIGVACRDFESEEKNFAAFGYRPESSDVFDPIQGVHIRFLVGGGPRLELLRNHAEPGVLTPWLQKGVRLYHLAYETPDIAAVSRQLTAAGAKEVGAPVPAVAFDGRLVSFHLLANLTMIELISLDETVEASK